MAKAKKSDNVVAEDNAATEQVTDTQTVEADEVGSLTEEFVTEVIAQAELDPALTAGAAEDGLLSSETEELPTEGDETENATQPSVAPAGPSEDSASEQARSEKPVYLGKYAGTHSKLNGEIPTDFKYLNVELFPGHPTKGYLRAQEPQKAGAKVRAKAVMTVVYEIAKKHYDETGTGIKGRELIYAMAEHDWRGTNSPYCQGGTPTYVWIKDYIIGAARPNAQHLVLKETDIPKPKAAPAAAPSPSEPASA